MRKIHCIEIQKKDFDKFSMNEIQNMIGWVEPPDEENGTWDVTLVDGYFECKDQATAQIISELVEIKALLLIKENKND